MGKTEEYIRVTLRLPPEVYSALLENQGSLSLNSSIAERLRTSLDPEHVAIRLPTDLREHVDKAARAAGQPLTTEILRRLNQTIVFDNAVDDLEEFDKEEKAREQEFQRKVDEISVERERAFANFVDSIVSEKLRKLIEETLEDVLNRRETRR